MSLKERIYEYADLLSRYESFYLTGLRVAAEIVHYEFSKDGVCDCYPSLAPPLHPPEMAGVNLRNLQVIDFFPGLAHKRRGRDRTR